MLFLGVASHVGCSSIAPEEKAKPVILIGCSPQMSEITRNGFETSIPRAGGEAKFMTDHVYSLAQADSLMDLADGLIIPGSSTMGGAREASEKWMIQAAIAKNRPILGICNGHQIINKYFGGTLSKITVRWPEEESHYDISTPKHTVVVDKSSHLYQIVGTDTLHVNSFHYYANDLTGEGITVSAWSPDGVIVEALEMGDKIIGVQFHPEYIAAKESDTTCIKLFKWLVDEAAKVVR